MKNKYKNSWKRIESLDIWSIPYSIPSSNWGEYLKCGDDIEASYQISEDLEIIKELVDKETPMKPKWVEDYTTTKHAYHPLCQKCKSTLSDDREFFYRCRNIECEQLIDWGDVDWGNIVDWVNIVDWGKDE